MNGLCLEVNNNKPWLLSRVVEESHEYLFPPVVLQLLMRTCRENPQHKAELASLELFPEFELRPLSIKDYEKGFLKVLAQLTDVGDVTKAQFEAKFQQMRKCLDCYYVVVVEDRTVGQVIATGTLVLEHKFIHSAGHRGRLEDLVVLTEYRGKKLGQIVMKVLTLLAESLGCYKASLECKDRLITYYEQFGYQKDVGNNFLVQRFTSS